MNHTSVIELSEKALKTNIKFLRDVLGSKCLLSSVVKGNAYGHGIETFVPLANKCGVEHFSVFTTGEAHRVHSVLDGSCDIMIMGVADRTDLEWIINSNNEILVFDVERLEAILDISAKLKKKARIHIEFETGMNRTGFQKKELNAVIKLLNNKGSHVVIEGMCTHLAGAESIANYHRIQKQLKKFDQLLLYMKSNNVIPLKKHTACSAAIMNYPKTRMDMVRVGIMQFGFWPSRETLVAYLGKKADKVDPLHRVISWKSSVMSVKSVEAGEFIGYGTTFMAEEEMRIAVIPVGYSQGYSRSLSNQGRLLLKGHRVGVVGIVNMNMLIVDISKLPDVQIGDEVVLIGNQEGQNISVASFSELSSQLNYELLTRLPADIPRIITK